MCFDPQALTSLTQEAARDAERRYGFDPQALTSLTIKRGPGNKEFYTFRSTGSYEPDPCRVAEESGHLQVSIHRLLRA